MKEVNKELLLEFFDSYRKMIVYVEDEILDKYNEDSKIYKEVEKANKLLDKLYNLSIENK